MRPLPPTPRQIFDTVIPRGLQEDIVTCGRLACVSSYRYCLDQDLLVPSQRYILSRLRRALFEHYLQHRAQRYPGITARFEKTATRNFDFLQIAAEHFLLTVVQTDTPDEPVRYSQYREELASIQYSLFEETKLPDLSDYVHYGTILFGPAELGFKSGPSQAPYSNRARLGYMRVAFPGPDLHSFNSPSVDLLRRFPVTQADHVEEETEVITEALNVWLRANNGDEEVDKA